MKDLSKILSNNENLDKLSDFLLKRNIEHFLNGVLGQLHPLTDKVIKYTNLPLIGSHLKTARLVYTHHGIYVGNRKVIHYSGLADGLNSGPVEEISLHEFENGKGYSIVPHPHTKFSSEKIVFRAYERIAESKYNLIFNNCEHFVNWCIYGVNQSQQVKGVAGVISTTINNSLKKSNPIVNAATSLAESSKYLLAYMKGEITKEKLFEEISHTAITSASTSFYAAFGQTVIPIPVVGALIGASIGYFIGNTLYNSGLLALGEAPIVKEARVRREKVKLMCDTLIPIIRKNRKELDKYINEYFSDRKKVFDESFNMLDLAIKNNNINLFTAGLEKINNQFDKSLTFKKFDEFEDFMLS